MSIGTLITNRRNFLVRAAGFVAVTSPAVAAAALARPDLPVITPEMVEKIAAWKAAYWRKRDLMKALAETGASAGHPVHDADSPFWRADDDLWRAYHAMGRVVLGIG